MAKDSIEGLETFSTVTIPWICACVSVVLITFFLGSCDGKNTELKIQENQQYLQAGLEQCVIKPSNSSSVTETIWVKSCADTLESYAFSKAEGK